MIKAECEKCGEVHTFGYDGYGVSKFFDGMVFVVTLKNGEINTIGARPEDEDYYNQFNKDYWFPLFKQDIIEDINEGVFYCMSCSNFVTLRQED